MNFKIIIFIIITLFSINLLANDQDISKILTTVDKLKPKQDNNLENVKLNVINSYDGTYEDNYDTASDKNKFSIIGHINHNPTALLDILGIELNFGSQSESRWFDYFLSATTAYLPTIAISNFPPINEQIFSAGFGRSYRFRLIQQIFSTDTMFETVAAYLAGHYMQELNSAETYYGPGIKTDYGLHFRTGKSFAWGTMFSYNVASLQGATTNSQLTMSWLTLSFGLHFYY